VYVEKAQYIGSAMSAVATTETMVGKYSSEEIMLLKWSSSRVAAHEEITIAKDCTTR
jgi:hypothetical protein